MRFFLLLLICLFYCWLSCAQVTEQANSYVRVGPSLGSHFAGEIAYNRGLRKGFVFEVGLRGASRVAKDLPDDFTIGNPITEFVTLGFRKPRTETTSIFVNIGRVNYLNARERSRLILKGGLSFNFINFPTNWTSISANTSDDGANYLFQYDQQERVGIIINPVLEFPLNHWLGYSVGLFSNINGKDNQIGIEFKGIIGRVGY